MQITLNGDPKEVAESLTLQQLLDSLKIAAGRVACEVNMKIIKRAFYAETPIHSGDTIEIIQAIGGG